MLQKNLIAYLIVLRRQYKKIKFLKVIDGLDLGLN